MVTSSVSSRRLPGGKAARGNLHSTEGWEALLLPEIERQQKLRKVVFRAEAPLPSQRFHEALESRGVK
jgi:hypothetical protein